MAVTYRNKQIFCLVYCCVLFMSGVFVICMTTVVSYKMFIHSRFVPNDNLGPLIILLLLGFFQLFLTWIGVKGPTREHTFYIVMLVVVSIAIAAITLAALIWTIILYYQSNGEVEEIMRNSFVGFLEHGHDIKDWTMLEGRYKCCGVLGPEDYTVRNCTKSLIGCKEPYIHDVHGLFLQILAVAAFVFVQNVIGCVMYFEFKRALHEERDRRAKEKRERMLRARARRLSQR